MRRCISRAIAFFRNARADRDLEREIAAHLALME
jgi:hypothetical protein